MRFSMLYSGEQILSFKSCLVFYAGDSLRSVANKNYVLPQAKCNLFKGSLSFSGVLVWNSIPLDIKKSSSLQMFIKRCSEWIKR